MKNGKDVSATYANESFSDDDTVELLLEKSRYQQMFSFHDTIKKGIKKGYIKRVQDNYALDTIPFADKEFKVYIETPQREYEKYINAGCRKTKVLTGCSADRRSELGSCQVLLMTLLDDWRTMFDSFVETATSQSVLLVMNIDVTRETRQAWRRIMDDSRTGVTFDLLDCGIVFFDLKMHKQNYKINY